VFASIDALLDRYERQADSLAQPTQTPRAGTSSTWRASCRARQRRRCPISPRRGRERDRRLAAGQEAALSERLGVAVRVPFAGASIASTRSGSRLTRKAITT
jgi:hypothetical protein